MERKFCSKCGALLGECTCNVGINPTPVPEPKPKPKPEPKPEPTPELSGRESTEFGRGKKEQDEANRSGRYYIKRFDKIALIQGEQVVRKYHIGEFAKRLGAAGKGSASIIITNKRVISKQDSDYFGSSSTSVEEISLDSVAGVKNYYAQGFTIWRIVLAIFWGLAGITVFFSAFGGWDGFDFGKFIIGLLGIGVAVYMGIKSRKPSYFFSIYASTVNEAMQTGVNLRGKVFNSGGYGIVFQYKPTEEAVEMMCEIGACIVDLKQKGDYAIEAWKKA